MEPTILMFSTGIFDGVTAAASYRVRPDAASTTLPRNSSLNTRPCVMKSNGTMTITMK
jgi:hypothetical protein